MDRKKELLSGRVCLHEIVHLQSGHAILFIIYSKDTLRIWFSAAFSILRTMSMLFLSIKALFTLLFHTGAGMKMDGSRKEMLRLLEKESRFRYKSNKLQRYFTNEKMTNLNGC